MKLKSNVDWRAWGEIDPLYGVATHPGKSRGDAAAWKDEEFYQIGAADWQFFRQRWERYGLHTGSCLEIGCGAGRITRQLGHNFEVVHALDVSEGMIEYARRNVNTDVVQFHVTDGSTLPVPSDSIDAVFSTHVFQHLESSADGAVYFREIYRVLRTEGTIMIHLPIIVWPSGSLDGLHKQLNRLKLAIANGRAQVGRWAFSLGLRKEPWMRGTLYEVEWLHATLTAIGFRDVELGIYFLPTSPVGKARHPVVFARK